MWVRRVLVFVGIGIFTMLAGGFVMGWISSSGAAPGLTADGRLAACKGARNCVSSHESADSVNYVDPLPRVDKAVLKARMEELGARLITEEKNYLAFTTTSAFFRFVDDIEFIVMSKKTQVRSASRVGRNDFGANRKRVETLRVVLAAR